MLRAVADSVPKQAIKWRDEKPSRAAVELPLPLVPSQFTPSGAMGGLRGTGQAGSSRRPQEAQEKCILM